MLSTFTARALRDAGLQWAPADLDYFAIPLAGFEDQVFVISNMTVMAESIKSRLAITFHGSVEWALDHVWAGDVLWIPREDQLRELLEDRLVDAGHGEFTLSATQLGYRCDIVLSSEPLSFEAFEAGEAYASALLHLLRQGNA